MKWHSGIVHDCNLIPLNRYEDSRGWLSELFRHDELPVDIHPAMAYVSLTHQGITRGPHEHVHQTDLFIFFHGSFRVYLWDHRKDSLSYGIRQTIDAGKNRPLKLVVPPGVIHAYRNMGTSDALVINCPNQLYAGKQKLDPIDEIRWEERTDHNLIID
ncbi:MAG: dTDP-4-dehydrorhamnose 3,5-epimerase family protein [Bacteroidetes bacterium]|nr:dTDP-4-dehydrorhamnose 3,5-epimerase family protein [Bacteroidota bacterium]MCY4233549.1 dTDP-4-dehydrorhamnose 3,5-epimerase family protein [Bacteroidota bacterium]